MINQEELYQAIHNENWSFLVTTLHKNKNDISSDSLLKLATETFIFEFLSKVNNYPDNHEGTILNLEMLWIIDQGKYYKLKESDHKKLVCQIVRRKRNKLGEAYNYAKFYPEEVICKSVIEEYEKVAPKVVEHTQTHRISVTERKEVANVDYTTNLFKSVQETEFFYALKRTYDSYQIYPNVAISCLLNLQLLEDELTYEEKDYYFKGIVDFVVFDQAEGFKPIHFFELDSVFHDTDQRKKKDSLKDSIFSKAGVNIIRIRKQDKSVNEQEFIKLIRELMK